MLVSACVAPPARIGFPGSIARNRTATVRVQVKEGSSLVVREVPLEEYVAGTALSEVHPDIADTAIAERIYEVQAVLARTYAVANRGRHARDGFDLCSTTHCQLYEPSRLTTSRWALEARRAAESTAGEVVWFADTPALALYHADCGGHTSSATAVWGGPAPLYLAGEADDGPASRAHAEWTLETKTSLLRAALDADPRTDVGPTLDRIDIGGRDAAGRAEQIILRGSRTFVVRGEVFREAVTRAMGAGSLRSTLFTVKKTRDGFVFSGKGYGHGVGLCQVGAIARLRAGLSPDDVLRYYFPGTTIRR
jgi:stage II sporulation protein D